jgi:signal recognition particle GTPase
MGTSRSASFTIDDYLVILHQLQRLDSRPLAGISTLAVAIRQDERTAGAWPLRAERAEGIVRLMKLEERCDPGILDRSRRKHLAAVSGTRPDEVNDLIRHFCDVRDVADDFIRAGRWSRLKILLRNDPVFVWLKNRAANWRAQRNA